MWLIGEVKPSICDKVLPTNGAVDATKNRWCFQSLKPSNVTEAELKNMIIAKLTGPVARVGAKSWFENYFGMSSINLEHIDPIIKQW
jgi:hypothetical protein